MCGISIADFNASTDQENVDYRLSLLNITKEVVQFRDKGGNKALASYFYPSQLENQDTFAKDMKNSLEGGTFDCVTARPIHRSLILICC